MAKTINVPEISKAGPYSHAISTGNLLFLSGQVGTLPNKTQNLEEQFENIMSKINKILNAGGLGLENIVRTTVYLSKKEDFPKLNELYSKHFVNNPPTRTTVVTGFVSNEVLLEIDAIASK